MYLIDTRTLHLVDSPSSSLPEYAILSHTWGLPSSEVTFQEMLANERPAETTLKPGFIKILKTCEIALHQYGLSYAWVDTCCIDKSSSAELSEAINSMYRWYQGASICLAYLEDVTDGGNEFIESRWFRRGWTLQELIAPSYIIFFDQQWNPLGPRGDLYGLFSQIVEVTGIPLEILDHTTEVNEIPVAQRFSWAADRETTRIEDIAYCLLGIFDVNMPMLYGEGPKAFLRLQEQILAQSADLSLFLWTIDSQEDFSGLLATSPACFREMKHVAVEPSFTQREFYLTNRGIRFKMGLAWDPNTGLAIMPVKHIVSYTDSPVGIQLRRVGLDTFVRARPGDFTIVSSLRQFDTFTVVKDLTHRQAEHLKRNTLMIDASRDIMITEVEPKGSWAPDSQHLHPSYTGAFLGYMVFQKYQFPTFTVVFWFHRGLWSASVVQADEWARIRRDFYQHYKNRTPALGGDLGRPILSSISNAKESNILIHAVRRVEDEKHGRRWTMAIRSEGSVERRVLP